MGQVGEKKNRVPALQVVRVALHFQTEMALRNHEILCGPSGMCLGLFDRVGQEAKFIELDASGSIHRKERACTETTILARESACVGKPHHAGMAALLLTE